MRISDWSSDVCSSDLCGLGDQVAGVHADDAGSNDALRGLVEYQLGEALGAPRADRAPGSRPRELADADLQPLLLRLGFGDADPGDLRVRVRHRRDHPRHPFALLARRDFGRELALVRRSAEHTSELQSLMRISYAVFCLKKKKQN